MPQFYFNGTTKVITIDPAFPEVDVSQMYSAWKLWAQDVDNFKYLQAMRTFGGDTTIEGQRAPAYFFLTNGWRCSVDGFDAIFSFNLYTNEGEDPVIPLNGGTAVVNNSDSPIVQGASGGASAVVEYAGQIILDVTNGAPGTAYPIGTYANPVDNFPDALTMARSYGFNNIFIMDGTAVSVDGDISNVSINGNSPKASVNVLATANVTGSTFSNLTVAGDFAGGSDSLIQYSTIGALANFDGEIREGHLTDTISLADGTNTILDKVVSRIPGDVAPIIDFANGTNIKLSVRAYSGGLQISNSTDVNNVTTLEYVAGKCNIDISNTAGYFSVRGLVVVTDSSTNTTVDTAGALSNTAGVDTAAIAQAVWSTPVDSQTDTTTMGGLVAKRLLSVIKYLALQK